MISGIFVDSIVTNSLIKSNTEFFNLVRVLYYKIELCGVSRSLKAAAFIGRGNVAPTSKLRELDSKYEYSALNVKSGGTQHGVPSTFLTD